MRAVVVERHGNPEVMEVRDVPLPVPAEGEVRVRVEAAGVNFHDVWVCRGLPGFVELPVVQGIELAGVVEEVGPGVDAAAWRGRRVAALPLHGHGAYAEAVVVPLDSVFPIPDSVETLEAAALPLNFLMAHAALSATARTRPGERVLVHAAAGGVGSAAVQLARHLGARVLGTASPPKHDFVREMGADPIDYAGDWVEAVLERTGGAGVDVVLDGVGEAGFEPSLRALGYGGRLVAFGVSSLIGDPGDGEEAAAALAAITFPFALLNEKARAAMTSHVGAPPATLRAWMDEILALHAAGVVRPRVDRIYALEDAPAALERLLERRNVGKVLLTP